jgi:hypothetical protein
MWIKKKPDGPQAANPEPKNLQTNQLLKPAPALWERTTRMNKDASCPTGETSDRAASRLGSSVHVKGEISGNEDLHIDGTAEGLVQLDERKLTIGTTAKVTNYKQLLHLLRRWGTSIPQSGQEMSVSLREP